MKQKVLLSIRGVQYYDDQEPDKVELLTEGEMERTNLGWKISYEETELTGLSGTTTIFEVSPNVVTLERVGALQSKMIFEEGQKYSSLYQVDVGAFMITVSAKRIRWSLTEEKGGFLDVYYGIDIEGSATGKVHYRIEVKLPKKN